MISTLTWPHSATAPAGKPPDRHVWLRLLETTDVHAHLVPYDYHRETEVADHGLARTATLIARARGEAENSLLLDNGDFLQGSVLGDVANDSESDWTGPHPVIAAMNRLGYDAAALGNHEFNYGLDWLTRVLNDARFPVVCANALLADRRDTTLRPPSVLLNRTLHDNHGQPHSLRLGVIGLLPPQISTWDHVHLRGRLVTRGIVETAIAEVPRLRASGADLVVALVHSGLGPAVDRAEDADPRQENAALALATVPGIDALLCGHTHKIFPDPAAPAATAGVDHAAGRLADVPAVMAGYRGSHLGVLDLCLVPQDGNGWLVRDVRATARAVRLGNDASPVPPDPEFMKNAQTAHRATLRYAARPVARSANPLHSYLAKLRPCDTLAPVLAAKTATLRAALAGTPDSDLPLLATTACFKAGGHGGPEYFVDIPAGPLTLGHAAEIYPFPNTLIGLRLTGAEIIDWLERAASCFNRILPGLGDTPQPLWNPAFASHAFDTVSELTYRIDLGHPPRYDAEGTVLNPDATRIRDLCHRGRPLSPDSMFCLATNNFRAFGSGPYPKATPEKVIYECRKPVRDHLVSYLREARWVDAVQARGGWRLDGPRDATVLLETGPGVRAHPKELAALSARDLGTDADGFLRLAIPMAALADLANPGRTS